MNEDLFSDEPLPKMSESIFSDESAPEKKGTPWSQVPSNAFKDIKSSMTQMADPMGLGRSALDLAQGKELSETPTAQRLSSDIEAVKHPIETVKEIGQGLVKPFLHPIESFKENPVNTAAMTAMGLGALPETGAAAPKIASETSAAPPMQSSGLRSAVKLRGKTYVGEPGEIHADVINKMAKELGENPDTVIDAINKIGDQGFTKGDQFLTRDEVRTMTGERPEAASLRAAGKMEESPEIKIPQSGVGKFMKNTGQSIEANATAGALDLNTYGINKLTKRGENPETVILDLNKKIKELMPDAIELSDTPSSKYQKFLDADVAASQTIGHVIDQTTKQTGKTLPEAEAAINELRAEANSARFKSATSQRNIDAKAELLDAANHLEELNKAGQLNFQNLYEVKKGIGEAYNNPNFDNPGIDKAYGIISDKINAIVDRASIQEPSLKNDFQHAKEVFKLTSKLLPVMKKGVSRDVAGAGGGLSNAALGAGAIFGHPLTAGAAYLGKTAAKLAAPDLMRNVAYKTVNAVKRMPNLPTPNINSAVAAYLASQYANKRK